MKMEKILVKPPESPLEYGIILQILELDILVMEVLEVDIMVVEMVEVDFLVVEMVEVGVSEEKIA